MRLLHTIVPLLLHIAPLLAATVNPRVADEPTPAPDNATLHLFDKFARYASAAYCRDLQDNESSKVCTNAAVGACGDLADAVTVKEFGAKDTAAGFIAVSQSQKLIVVSFRGTNNATDVITDTKYCKKVPQKFELGARAIWDAPCELLPT
jgi:hypothetical protein